MLLLRTDRLPEGADWLYEIKLDGYRILAITSEGRVRLRSRNDNDFTFRYAQIASATPGATVGISQVALGRAYLLAQSGTSCSQFSLWHTRHTSLGLTVGMPIAPAVIITIRVPVASSIVVAALPVSDVNDYVVMVTMTMMFSLVVIASLNRARS